MVIYKYPSWQYKTFAIRQDTMMRCSSIHRDNALHVSHDDDAKIITTEKKKSLVYML